MPTNALTALIAQAIEQAGGRIGFDRFMELALYAPGLGYYSNSRPKIGFMPTDGQSAGSDFITAPQMSSLFGKTVARQIAQALEHTRTSTVYEFGAGTGVLALDILQTLGDQVQRYCIVDLSGSLKAQQAQTLAAFAHKVQWLDALPDTMEGVLLGNEVLDAMPVKLLHRQNGQWHERGVQRNTFQPNQQAARRTDGLVDGLADEYGVEPFEWTSWPTSLRPPVEIDEAAGDYLTEIHPQAQAFIRTVAERLKRGAALWIDYGFAEREYYHPQRHMGTLACHHQHKMDDNPLQQAGLKDITSHINFTGVAVAAQEAGLEVLGYTSQGHFLLNCGMVEWLEKASVQQRVMASKLVQEHEMGELFKVIMLGTGPFWEPLGFTHGDRTHTL